MFGLSFLYPAFLIGAAAAAIPIVLHLFRRQPEPRVRFSAVRFLRRAPVEQSRRRRLRELLLLALRVAALVLLALAFARPYAASGAATPAAPVTIVAIDTSFSMSAPGQFDRARQLARDAIAGAPSSHRMGLIAFADAATVVTPPSPGRGAALAALDRLQPGYGATRYRNALGRAAEQIGDRRGRIIVITDLQQSGWDFGEGAVPDRIAVDVVDAGAPAGNLAVSSLQRDAGGAVAVVRNASGSPASGRARLIINDRPVDEARFNVSPAVSSEVRFTAPLPDSGVAAVAIDDATGYSADNTRYLVLDPPEPEPILAITSSGNAASDAFYIDRALAVAGEAGRFRMVGLGGAALANLPPADLDGYAAALLLGTGGLERRGREGLASYVARGGGLLIVAGADVDPDVLQELLAGHSALGVEPAARAGAVRTFAPVDARHPIFRPFGAAAGNLGRVRFQRAVRLREPPGGRVVARFDDGAPALVEPRSGRGRLLVFASDLNNRWNNFPLQPTFVPFVIETARYLAATRERPREYLVSDAPAGVAATPGVARLPQTGANRAGSSGAGRRVAINVDTRESDPARTSPRAFAAAMTRLNRVAAVQERTEAHQQEERQRLWQYGLMLMLVTLAGEGILGSRIA